MVVYDFTLVYSKKILVATNLLGDVRKWVWTVNQYLNILFNLSNNLFFTYLGQGFSMNTHDKLDVFIPFLVRLPYSSPAFTNLIIYLYLLWRQNLDDDFLWSGVNNSYFIQVYLLMANYK